MRVSSGDLATPAHFLDRCNRKGYAFAWGLDPRGHWKQERNSRWNQAFDFSTTGEAGSAAAAAVPCAGKRAWELMPKCSGAAKAPVASAFLCLFHTRGAPGRHARIRVSGTVGYRWPNGPCHMGGTENGTKNTTRTRNDMLGLVSVSARHGRSVVHGL